MNLQVLISKIISFKRVLKNLQKEYGQIHVDNKHSNILVPYLEGKLDFKELTSIFPKNAQT